MSRFKVHHMDLCFHHGTLKVDVGERLERYDVDG
jgi:hypothetical protein